MEEERNVRKDKRKIEHKRKEAENIDFDFKIYSKACFQQVLIYEKSVCQRNSNLKKKWFLEKLFVYISNDFDSLLWF